MSNRVIYTGTNPKLTAEEILAIFNGYIMSETYHDVERYGEYYEAENCAIKKKVRDRKYRGKSPNNEIPTAYYSSVVDSMAGYLFSSVKYQGREEQDAAYVEALQSVLDANGIEIKDMATGVRALAYNKAYELIYTVGDGTTTQIKIASLDPESVFCIYNNDIEPKMICGVRFLKGESKEEKYKLDVIYADEWQRYSITTAKSGEQIVAIDSKPLFFPACPVIEYNTEVITDNAPFAVIIPYIDSLDVLLSGNMNDSERLADAYLVLGKLLKDEDRKHLDQIAAFEGFKQEDRAEFISKNNDPAFREYLTKLFTTEIYRHAHVVDWYGVDATQGNVSAKALKTRLFDMDMYSKRIEKVYRLGMKKRMELINFLMILLGYPVGVADVVFERTMPNDQDERILAVNPATFISDTTKQEYCGFDPEIEKERMEEQKAEAMKNAIDATSLFNPPTRTGADMTDEVNADE